MASNLQKQGFKGTRFVSTTIVWLTATAGWFYGQMDASEWITLSTFILGIYGVSEVGAKGATAYAVKQRETKNV